MRKSNLVKGFMLGLCMSALTSGVAFAQLATVPAVSTEAQTDEMKELSALQKEIDQYLLVDHVKEIEDKGFMINYTSPMDSYVEIGISPFSDENANYLYELFGKDKVKVVEFDQSVLYASGVADPAVVDDAIVDGQPTKEDIYTTMENTAEPVVNADGTVVTPEDKVYKGDTGEAVAEEANPEIIYYATDAGAGLDGKEVQIVSTTLDDVKSGAEEDTNGVSTPAIVLAIVCGAALVGGAIIISNKKKAVK
jgi:hypothetical protein